MYKSCCRLKFSYRTVVTNKTPWDFIFLGYHCATLDGNTGAMLENKKNQHFGLSHNFPAAFDFSWDVWSFK